jgi:hypothetical protein
MCAFVMLFACIFPNKYLRQQNLFLFLKVHNLRYIQGITASLVLWCSRLDAAICQLNGNAFFKNGHLFKL